MKTIKLYIDLEIKDDALNHGRAWAWGENEYAVVMKCEGREAAVPFGEYSTSNLHTAMTAAYNLLVSKNDPTDRHA